MGDDYTAAWGAKRRPGIVSAVCLHRTYTWRWSQAARAGCDPQQLMTKGEKSPIRGTSRSSSREAEFFLGHGREQRPSTAHTVTVNVYDLAKNLPNSFQNQGGTPDQTLVAGGPGSGLAGITQANRLFWFQINSLFDTILHEIRIFDHPDQESNLEASQGVQPPSTPIATFDFGVEPCPLVNPSAPGYLQLSP